MKKTVSKKVKRLILILVGLLIALNILILFIARDSSMLKIYTNEIEKYTGYNHLKDISFDILDDLDRDKYKAYLVTNNNIGVYPDTNFELDIDMLNAINNFETTIDGKDYYVLSGKNQRGDYTTTMVFLVREDVAEESTKRIVKFARLFSSANAKNRKYMGFLTIILSYVFLVLFIMTVILK